MNIFGLQKVALKLRYNVLRAVFTFALCIDQNIESFRNRTTVLPSNVIMAEIVQKPAGGVSVVFLVN